MRKRPTVFKSVVLPYIATCIIPVVILLAFGIYFLEFNLWVFLFIGLSSLILFAILGTFFIPYDMEKYIKELHKWKYHQITIDEYLAEVKE